MKHLVYYSFGLVLFLTQCNSESVDSYEMSDMKADLEYLASDELEGRETGTQGEALAAQFIAEKFKDLGLLPYGTEGSYFQEFEFKAKAKISLDNWLELDGEKLENGKAFYPISYSGNGVFDSEIVDINFAISAPELEYNDLEMNADLEGKTVLFDISSPDGIHPHSKYIEYHDIGKRIGMLEKIGVSSVLMYSTDENAEEPSKKISSRVTPYDFPVLFLKAKPIATKAKGEVEISRPSKTGKNVVAYLSNNAENTVVIGAHYDHLGHGDEGSLYRGDEKLIHNGADDNASGVVCLFELADQLKKKELKNNFVFVAFSGEEKGLLGSNYFVKNMPMSSDKVNYMLNMDMVGRLEGDKISINGIGTSPALEMIDSLVVGGLSAQTTKGGIGASDHTSFYLQNIPALHFFSGTHEDYHKPSDDSHKINYDGMQRIVEYMLFIVDELEDDGKLAFTKTKDDDSRDAPNFKVTLGVIPDYLFDGKGMRIDGTSEGRPAESAGLVAGDIVIKIGTLEVRDMYSYMDALSKFNEGETTEVIVDREGEHVKVNVLWD